MAFGWFSSKLYLEKCRVERQCLPELAFGARIAKTQWSGLVDAPVMVEVCVGFAGGRIEEDGGDGQRRTDLGKAGAVRRCGRRRWWKPGFSMVGRCLGFRNPLLRWSQSICRRSEDKPPPIVCQEKTKSS
ncbi:hypothetical protein U1Q18_037333 [Sarracenia purpurea var. burkii]